MIKQDTMRPLDLAVALGLTTSRGESRSTFSQLGVALGLSASTVHDSLQRLQAAGLVRDGTREPNRRALRDFVVHGARHVFPPSLGREMRGVPTAHAGPVLRKLFGDAQPLVWPDADGPSRGTAMAPLYPNAVHLPATDPELYNVLTLVDALRVGQARERNAARVGLNTALGLAPSEPVDDEP